MSVRYFSWSRRVRARALSLEGQRGREGVEHVERREQALRVAQHAQHAQRVVALFAGEQARERAPLALAAVPVGGREAGGVGIALEHEVARVAEEACGGEPSVAAGDIEGDDFAGEGVPSALVILTTMGAGELFVGLRGLGVAGDDGHARAAEGDAMDGNELGGRVADRVGGGGGEGVCAHCQRDCASLEGAILTDADGDVRGLRVHLYPEAQEAAEHVADAAGDDDGVAGEGGAVGREVDEERGRLRVWMTAAGAGALRRPSAQRAVTKSLLTRFETSATERLKAPEPLAVPVTGALPPTTSRVTPGSALSGFRGIKVHGRDHQLAREVCEVALRLRLPILVDVYAEAHHVDMLRHNIPA